jgi:hypothetical protein
MTISNLEAKVLPFLSWSAPILIPEETDVPQQQQHVVGSFGTHFPLNSSQEAGHPSALTEASTLALEIPSVKLKVVQAVDLK